MDPIATLIPYSLLVLALGAAWWAGYRSRFRAARGQQHRPEQDYFIGLNYLLNDEPDDAIDIFISALEQNSDTLETHLALCTLLRRRGKVDRAIAHAEQLLGAAHFSLAENNAIKLNLVRSHIAAGLLDRAERLLAELKQSAAPVRESALELANTVYQMERDWTQALDAALELLRLAPPERRAELELQCSHYHCELAETALAQHDEPRAREQLRRARDVSRHNVRSYLLLARVEESCGAWQEAAAALRQVAVHAPDLAGEAILPLLRVLRQSSRRRERDALLAEALANCPPSRDLRPLIQLLREQQGEDELQRLLDCQLRDQPSLALLAETLALLGDSAAPQAPVLAQGAVILRQYLQHAAQYRCENCGLELRNLHWQCPGCSRWGLVKPLDSKLPQQPQPESQHTHLA